MSRQKAKSERSRAIHRLDSSTQNGLLPLTVTRAELLNDGTDRDFRKFVHNIFAFMGRHETIRDGHARQIGLAGVEYTILISIGHLALDGDVNVNVKTVADHLRTSGAFITTVTTKLRSMGLIKKTQDSVDRRRTFLEITEKGKTLLRNLAAYQSKINDIEFSSLNKKEFKFLSKIIETLIATSDEAVALQRYKASQTDSEVA